MNRCFLTGKVTRDVQFEFMIDANHNSISIIEVILTNKTQVQFIAYDELADFCYQKLEVKNIIFIEGYLKTENQVEVITIKSISSNLNLLQDNDLGSGSSSPDLFFT